MSKRPLTSIALILLSNALTLILTITLIRCEHRKAIVEADLTRAVKRGVTIEGHWILCKQKCPACD